MRFDIRLSGKTEAGRAVVMELTVYAQSKNELLERAKQLSTEGAWYYQDNNEAVPTTEKITVEGVKEMKETRPRPGKDPRKWLKS